MLGESSLRLEKCCSFCVKTVNLLTTLWIDGYDAVKMDMKEGTVQLEGDIAWENETPRDAKASSVGVVSFSYPK